MTRLLFFLIMCGFAYAEDINLAWDPSTSPNIAGYKVYVGNASRTYDNTITLGNQTTHTITNLGDGAWYFAVTAFNIAEEESDFSNEVFTTIPSIPPALSITSMVSSRRWFGVVLQCTTSINASARLRYQEIGGGDLDWTTVIATTEPYKTLHQVVLYLEFPEGVSTYWRYEWIVEDANGSTSTLGGTFLTQ